MVKLDCVDSSLLLLRLQRLTIQALLIDQVQYLGDFLRPMTLEKLPRLYGWLTYLTILRSARIS
jgi:hypothetical protein